MLLYGPNGAGKTHLAGTGGGLIINVEQGETTLITAGMKVPVWPIVNPDEIWEVYDYLLTPEGLKHPSVAIDSYTDLVAKYLEQVVAEAEEKDPHRLTDAAELRDHGRVTLKLGKVLRRFRDLPQDVILICGEREPDDQDPRFRPNLPQGVSRQARDYCDLLGYLAAAEEGEDDKEKKIVRRILFWSPTGAILCRDRNGVFTMETGRRGLVNPTFPSIKEYIREHAGGQEEAGAKARPKRSKR
jgi:energy-coupling factor transporter ATP-binding protein EcfA2